MFSRQGIAFALPKTSRSAFRRTFSLALAMLLAAGASFFAAAQNGTDSDGDGLSDALETSIHDTNPAKADTDGDGQPDGHEVRAGTDPRSSGSVLRILDSPQRLPQGGWRIRWSSVPGKTYRLMRWNSDDLSLRQNPLWVEVASVTATGNAAQADDPSATLSRRYYRIALAESSGDDRTPPVLSSVKAAPAAASAEGFVTLTVEARDTNAISSVAFYDGASLIGAGAQIDTDEWRLNWPVTFDLNGARTLTAQAVDAAGNRGTSAPVVFNISIPRPQASQVVGQVPIHADRLQTNGAVVAPTGNIRIGLATLSSNSTVTVNPAQGALSGHGKVSLPGVGQVFDGSFVVNTATGELSPSGAASAFSSIPLSPTASLLPQALKVNLLSGALAGRGSFSLQTRSASQLQNYGRDSAVNLGPVRIEGDFILDLAAQSATVTGKAIYAGVEGSGVITLSLANSTFHLTGEASIDDGAAAFRLREALFKMEWNPDRSALFTLSGKPSLPRLPQLNLTLAGQLNTAGELRLSGQASATLAGIQFAPLALNLSRAAGSQSLELKAAGTAQVQGLASATLEGRLLTDGAVAELTSTGEVNFGNGVRLGSRKDGQGRDLPVLRLTGDANGVTSFAISADFQGPAEGGTQPVAVQGQMELAQSLATQVRSFIATNSAALPSLRLPGSIELQNASVLLSRADNRYSARLRGQLTVAKTGPVVSASLGADLLLQISESNLKAITIESDLNFAGVNLRDLAWFTQGQLRVSIQTAPPAGAASLRNAAAGLFPTDAILSNGRIITTRPLTAADFHLFATNAAGSAAFANNGLDLALTSGALRLPNRFTTLAAGECAQNTDLPLGGAVPSVALAPGSALTLRYGFGQSPQTATLRFEGAFDFANLGVAVPASAGQPSPAALKLCSARLVFRGSELPALENLSGKIRVRDLGAFTLASGALDPRGVFSIRAHGQASLNGVAFDLASFDAAFNGSQFSLSAASSLDLGDGIRLEPDDITTPGQPAPPVISASYNTQTQSYDLALAGKLRIPDAQYVAMRGRVSNGALTLVSQGSVRLGPDILFRPATPGGNAIPVLQLEAVTEGGVTRAQLALAGELLAPGGDGQLHPLAMIGKLRLRAGANGQPQVQSLDATAALPSFDFGGGVRLAALDNPADTSRKLPIATLSYSQQSGYRIAFGGQLLAPGVVQRVQLAGSIQNNQLALASVGVADLGNNFKISPIIDPVNGELPSLRLEVVTNSGVTRARFNLSGNAQAPGASGAPRTVQVTGSLVLSVDVNGAVKLESFSAVAAAALLDLGSGLRLEALPDPSNAALRLPIVSAVYSDGSGYEVRLAGKVALSGSSAPQYVTLQGRVNNSLLELNSFAAAHLGNGVWIQPLNNQPTIQLLASQGAQNEAQFAINGAFLVPGEATPVRSVAVSGSLRIEGVAGGAQIKSFSAASATTNDWRLPGSIRLQQAGARLSYATNRFIAELAGQMQVGPSTAALDHAVFIFEDESNAANLRLDTQVTLRAVPLGEVARLQVGSARLELATALAGTQPRNAFGRLSLGGSAGLFSIGALPAEPGRTNFHLFVENAGAAVQFSASGVTFSLTNGLLRLPAMLSSGATNLCPGGANPFVALGTNTAIELTYTAPGSVALSTRGTLRFGNLGFDVPGMPGLAAQLCSATLVFQGNQLPTLAGVSGSLRIPVSEQNLQLSIVEGAWKLNGYPSGTILLAQDFKLLDREGFTLTLLGGPSCGDNTTATGITIAEGQTLSNPPRPPEFTLHGGMRFAIPESVLRKAASAVAPESTTPPPRQVSVEGCGSVTFYPDRLPNVQLSRLTTSGDFLLGQGGSQADRASLHATPRSSYGIGIRGATVTLENIGNMFNFSRNPSNPFTISLTGLISVPSGPAFGLRNTRFVFDNANPRVPLLPRFEPGSLEYQKNEWALMDMMPIQVRLARLEFKDGTKDLPDILKPDNVKVTFSGGVSIPADEPYVQGDVNDLQVTFLSDGTPQFSVDGFALTLAPGMDVPPIEEISGSVYVGGLSHPINPFFTGRVAGSYQGYKLKFLLAFNLTGMVGMCVDVNAGAAGIPLDATGFLITGASGGLSTANSNGDPCSFQTYMDPVTGRPISSANGLPQGVPPFPITAMSWTQMRQHAEKFQRAAEAYGQATAAAAATTLLPDTLPPQTRAALHSMEAQSDPLEIPCPGDCPPPTVNIFCQPHPDQNRFPGRIITKFTSIDETTLNRFFGITEERVQSLLNSGASLAQTLARELRVKLESSIPAPDAGLLGAGRASQIRQLQLEAFDAMEAAYFQVLSATLANESSAGRIYGLIRDLVYAGLPCADATFQVSGTMSHLAVSSFLSVTGNSTLSTAGSVGVGGTVNVFGLPVGQGKLFVAATDDQGLPNPSVCGEINVAFGPLDLGWMKAAMQCDECVTGVLNVFGQLAASLSADTLNNLVAKVAPQFAGSTPQQLAARLSNLEKTAFMADLFQLPAASLPSDLPQRLITALGATFDSIDPRVLLCGEVRPRLFGLPLAPELLGASMQVHKGGRDVSVKFSPSFLLSLILDPRFMPPVDTAVLSYSEVWPDPAKALLAGLSGSLNPATAPQFVEDNIRNILENSTYTINYELSPLGIKIGRAAARVVTPNLLRHPVIRVPAWKRPEDRGLISRADLLLAAVRANLLGNPLWKGTTNDLANIFTDEASRSQLRGLSLMEDYFPHGGFIGAGYIQLPRALYEAPVSLYQTMLDPNGNPEQRLRAAATFVLEYLLQNVEAGQIGFYVPAPNPPAFTDGAGRPLPLSQLLESITQFDVSNTRTASLYAFDQSFLGGEITGKLLDIPIARAKVVGLPADAGAGRSESILQITANGPTEGWLRNFVPQANLIFEMRQAPPQPIEDWAASASQRLNAVLAGNPSSATALSAVQMFASELATNLPKTKLEAELALQIPSSLANLVKLEGNTSGRLVAYSPQYDPSAPGSGPIAEAKRKGGIALQANLKFGEYFSVPNAELSVLPRHNDLPILSGRFGPTSATLPGGVAMRNVMVDFNSGAPSLAASGSISSIELGTAFQLVPLSGSEIPAQLQLSGGAQASFKAGPARLAFSSVFGGGTAIRAHGATASDPFTFSTSGPWSANLTFDGSGPIEIAAGGETILQITRSGLRSAGLSRDEQGAIRLRLGLGAQTVCTAFPNQSFRQSFTLASDAELVVGSDGSFTLDAAISDQQAGGVSVSGRVILTNTPEVSFTLGGSLTLPALPGFAILPRASGSPLEGSLVVRRNGSGQWESVLRLKPARFSLAAVGGSARDFLIDGGSATQDFTFSPTGPWSARLTTEGSEPRRLELDGLPLLEYAAANAQSATVSRDDAGVARVTVQLRGQTQITAFPGSPVAQTFQVNSDTALTFGSDGKLLLDAAVNDQAFGQATLQGRARLTNDPQLLFSLGGRVTLPALTGFSLLPRASGSGLEGFLEIKRESAALAASLRLKPALLSWSTGLGASRNFLIDGGSDTQDFTFSTSGPWSARLRLENANPIEIVSGATVVLRLNQSQIQSGNISRDSSGVARLKLTVAGGTTLTAFPENSFAQTFTLSSATELSIGSNGEFSFNGLIQDQVLDSITLRGSVSLSNTPGLRFTLGGALTVPSMGGMSILPLVEGGPLEGSFIVEKVDNGTLFGGLSGSLRIRPARFTHSGVLGSQIFQIDGGSSKQDFAFSISGPWSARLTQSGGSALELSAGPVKVASIARSGALSGTVGRDTKGNTQMSLAFDAGTQITAFPDFSFRQSYHTQSSASLFISSGGTFRLAVKSRDAFALSGLPFTGLAAGTDAVLTQSGLSLSGSASGGLLASFPISGGASVTAAIEISASGLAFPGSVNVTLDPLLFGPFAIRPVGASVFAASLSSAGLAIPGGAQLTYNGRSLGAFTLPSFTIPASGNVRLNLSKIACDLGPQAGTFRIESAALDLTLSRGAGSARFSAGSLVLPAPGGGVLARVNITGDLNSDGTFSLSGRTSGGLNPSGLPFGSMSGNALAVLSQNGLTVEGTVSGGALGFVTVTGGASVTAKMALSATGAPSLSASVNVEVEPLEIGPFRIAPVSTKTFAASLTSGGVRIPSGARLVFDGQTLVSGSLPAITIPSGGAIDFSLQPASVPLGGFTLTSPALRFQSGNGDVSLTFTGGGLQLPVLAGGKPAGASLSGSINAKGDYNLSGSVSGVLSLNTLPIPAMTMASATARLRPSGLTVTGNLSGGLLAVIPVSGNVQGIVNLPAKGAMSLQGSASVSAQPIHAAPFHIEPVSGSLIGGSLANNGFTLSGARLRVDGLFGATVELPPITVQDNGSFTRTVTAPSLTLGGIPCSNVSFTLVRSGNTLSLSPMEAWLNIPGFSQRVSGSISSSGTMDLTHTGSLTMGGFAASNGKLTLSGSGLKGDGSFAIKALNKTFNSGLSFSGFISSSGGYTLTGNGRLNFGGFDTGDFNMRLTRDGLFPASGASPNLDFGGLQSPISAFGLTPAGVNSFSCSRSVDSRWKGFAGVNARLAGTVNITSAGDGSISARLSATFYWFFGPLPKDDYWPGSQNYGVSNTIGSDGRFHVNDNRGAQNGFSFDLW